LQSINKVDLIILSTVEVNTSLVFIVCSQHF